LFIKSWLSKWPSSSIIQIKIEIQWKTMIRFFSFYYNFTEKYYINKHPTNNKNDKIMKRLLIWSTIVVNVNIIIFFNILTHKILTRNRPCFETYYKHMYIKIYEMYELMQIKYRNPRFLNFIEPFIDPNRKKQCIEFPLQ
jgi:tetrahydrodipicolinate N-succinyltransferase